MDCVAALALGHLFYRHGVAVLLVDCVLSALASPLALRGGFAAAMGGWPFGASS
jgi:hypothetical protein